MAPPPTLLFQFVPSLAWMQVLFDDARGQSNNQDRWFASWRCPLAMVYLPFPADSCVNRGSSSGMMSYRAGSATSTVPAVIGGGTNKAARHGAVCALSVCSRSRQTFGKERENATVVKLRVRAGESIQEAVRRFRKLCERSGLRKEMRRKAYYEKPSERRRREELKRLRKARQHQTSRV